MSDHFDGIFDDLNPDDFRTPVPTTGTPLPHDPNTTFDEFVSDQIASLRVVFEATGGEVTMLAYLTTDDTKYLFTPTGYGEPNPETLDQFIDRLHVEAEMLGARMFFVNRRTQGGVTLGDPISSRPDDPDTYRQVLESGRSGDVMFYFAQHRHDLLVEYRHGIMFVEGNTLGEPHVGWADVTGHPYAQILKKG